MTPVPQTAAARVFRLAGPALLCALAACSLPPDEPAARAAAKAADAPLSANQMLAQACRKEAAKTPIGSTDPCALTAKDCEVLEEIDDSTDKAFEQALDPGLVARWLGLPLAPLGGTSPGWNFKPVCDQRECRIPVVVQPKTGTMKRCEAVLPYLRYCVRPVQGDPSKKPQELVFYLAREDGRGGLVALTPQDGFEFVPKQKGPPPYHQADVVGVDLHEDAGPFGRRPMAKPYFDSVGRSADGLSFTWRLTAQTMNTLGPIGRIHDGVLSAAFVRPTGSTPVDDICRPRDPIIVNTAN